MGKSTLCNCISGIIPLIKGGMMRGDVLINGKSTKEQLIAQISTSLGMVFQDPDTQLFSPTVEDEIAFGPEKFMFSKKMKLNTELHWHYKKVGIENLRFQNPKHLSGGQKQLVALAATLSLGPEIIIFDEAMSQLDTKGTKMVKELIEKLKEEGKTIIMVEHDLDNLHLANRVKLLHDGKLVDFNGELEIT